MPQQFSQEDLAYMKAKGIDPLTVQIIPDDATTIPQTIGRELRAKAGGLIGGGVGTLLGASRGALMGAAIPGLGETGISEAGGAIIGGILGGAAGGYGGQKLQQGLTPPEVYNQQQLEASQAASVNPKTALATDIVASALASGGKPSSDALKGVSGLIGKLRYGADLTPEARQALIGTTINAGVNPAINTGINVATTGQLPSASDIAAQIAGGALFSKQAGWASRLTGNTSHAQPAPDEPSTADPTNGGLPQPLTRLQLPQARRFYGGESGSDVIDINAEPVADTNNSNPPSQPTNDKGQLLLPEKSSAPLSHGDEVHVIDQNGNPIIGHVVGSDDNGNTQIIDHNNNIHTLPEQYANPQQTTMETVRSNPPGLTPQVAKRVPGGLQQTPVNSETETQGLPTSQQTSTDNGQKGGTDLSQQPTAKPWYVSEQERIVNNLGQDKLNQIRDLSAQRKTAAEISNITGLETKDIRTARSYMGIPSMDSKTEFEQWLAKNKISNKEDLQKQLEDSGDVSYSSNYTPTQAAVKTPNGKIYTGRNHGEAFNAATDAGEKNEDIYPKGEQGFVNKNGDFLTRKQVYDQHGVDTAEQLGMVQSNSYSSDNRILLPSTETPRPIQQYITQQNGKAKVGEILHGWVTDNPDHKYTPIMQELLDKSDPRSLNAVIRTDPRISRSNYSNSDDAINMAPNDISNPKIILHEIVHALTLKKLPNQFLSLQGQDLKGAMDEYLKTGKSQAVKDLISSYYTAADKLGISDKLFKEKNEVFGIVHVVNGKDTPIYQTGIAGHPDKVKQSGGDYGMGNLHEFMSEAMSSQDFQKKLDKIPSGTNGVSLWAKLKDAIVKLLGFEPMKGGLLEKALDATHRIIGEDRPEGKLNKQNGKVFAPQKDIPQTKEGGFIGRKFQSMIDRISRIPHPDAIPLAGGLKKTLIEAQNQIGSTTNGVLSTAKKYGIKSGDYNDTQVDKARKWESIHNSDPSFMLKNNAQRALYAAIKNAKSISGSTQFRGNQPVYASNHARAFIQNPHHLETPIEPKVAKIIKEGTDLKSIDKFKQDYIDNATNNYGKSNADAVKGWKELVDNVTGKSSNTAPNMQKFAGARVAQGTPLPDSMRTKGIKSLEYYFNRLALNNSYYKNIESNPRIMAALGETKDVWGNDIPKSDNSSLASNQDVKKQLEEFHGHKLDQTAHNEEAISNLMTSMFIANPGLEVHKVISNIVGAISTADNPIQAAKSLGHALVNLKSGYDHSVANGVTRLTAKSTSNMWDSNATFAERLQGLAQGIRNIATGFGASTAFNDGLMQSSMEYVLPSKIAKANSGDITAMQFIRKLDPDYQKGRQYKPDEINKLASEAVGYIHGTHDGRTMPSWMAGDSEISGFFKLAHWSVSQTNRFISDIYNPATRGELGPLVTSIFGAAIGGYLIKDIREKLQGKKYALPSLEDIQNSDKGLSGNAGLIAYNAIAASQYAGFAGILSQIARVPFDIAYKNEPQGAAFPLDEIATDLAHTISSISTAAANDPHFNWFNGTKAVMNHVLYNDFQLGRIAINQGINNGFITGMPAEKKMLSDKIQQLRKFDMVEGLPYEENDPGSNPYMNLEQKKFHMEQNIPEAVKQLPGLVNETIQAYKSQPDVLLAKLKALKDSSYDTMPNPDTYPLEFHNYINYLDRESPGLGQSILQDYMRHKLTNQVKSSVVP